MVTAEKLVASILSDQAELLEGHAHNLQEHAAALRRMVGELGKKDEHPKPDGPQSPGPRPN
jgi:hypothetical protein